MTRQLTGEYTLLCPNLWEAILQGHNRLLSKAICISGFKKTGFWPLDFFMMCGKFIRDLWKEYTLLTMAVYQRRYPNIFVEYKRFGFQTFESKRVWLIRGTRLNWQWRM